MKFTPIKFDIEPDTISAIFTQLTSLEYAKMRHTERRIDLLNLDPKANATEVELLSEKLYDIWRTAVLLTERIKKSDCPDRYEAYVRDFSDLLSDPLIEKRVAVEG